MAASAGLILVGFDQLEYGYGWFLICLVVTGKFGNNDLWNMCLLGIMIIQFIRNIDKIFS